MFRKLDRYVVSAFLPDFVVTALAISGMLVVVDLFQNLGEFIRLGMTEAVVTIARYYGYYVPIRLPFIIPGVILVAAGLTLVRHAKHNEILAMKASGVSISRIVLPVFVAAGVLSILSALNNEWVVPGLWKGMRRLEQGLDGSVRSMRRIVKDRVNNMDVWVAQYDRKAQTMTTVFLWLYRDSKTPQSLIKAKRAKWKGKEWHLFEVEKSDLSESKVWLAPRLLQSYIVETSLDPGDLERDLVETAALNFFELRDLCRAYPDALQFHVNLHSRTVYPIKSIVLLLIGIPFLIGADGLSQSRFMGTLKCVLVCAAFYTLDIMACHFGAGGHLNPILAAWVPTVMFGAGGLLLFDGVRT